LEESTYADLLVHVVDGSDPDPIGQINAVRAVLADIGAAEIPELIVINKLDRAAADTLRMLHATYRDARFVSARTGEGIEELRTTIESLLPRPEIEIRALVPYERGDLVNRIHQTGEFLTTEHVADGTLVAALVSPALAAELAPYELVTSDTLKLD
jgi:GTP-binding protein HflX